MTNTFAQIDHLASAGDSPWHRASALTHIATSVPSSAASTAHDGVTTAIVT